MPMVAPVAPPPPQAGQRGNEGVASRPQSSATPPTLHFFIRFCCTGKLSSQHCIGVKTKVPYMEHCVAFCSTKVFATKSTEKADL